MSRSSLTTNVHLGIIAMLAGILLLSIMDAAAKLLVESGFNPIQIIALRSLLIVPAMLFVFALRGQLMLLKPTRRYWQALRGLTGFIAPFCFFLALRYLPLSDAVVVFFSSTFVTTMLSVLVLRERVGIHRWAAVAIGYVGVVVAMAPQGQGQLAGYLLVLASGLSYAFLI
jgi:drug/metabolite transporter (DMT)-like permease